MGTMMLVIIGGLCIALITFFICEEKSLKDANFSDMKCLVTESVEISQCFEQFKTIKYIGIYFIVLVVLDLSVAKFVFVPQGFGLLEIMTYTFIPSLIGSGIILLIKWTYQPVIKLISSFLYGSVFMAASALSFAFTYSLL